MPEGGCCQPRGCDQHCGRMEGPRWYVVATEHQQERLASQSIREAGFQTFLPLIRLRVAATSKAPPRSTNVPAFPGYVFALWDDGDRWQRIKAARGCASILTQVGRSEEPASGPTRFMHLLLARASALGVIEDLSAPDILPAIEAGGWVRITKGPLAGRIALCEWSSEERVALLLEMMGTERRAKLRRDYVEPTDQPL